MAEDLAQLRGILSLGKTPVDGQGRLVIICEIFKLLIVRVFNRQQNFNIIVFQGFHLVEPKFQLSGVSHRTVKRQMLRLDFMQETVLSGGAQVLE